MSPYKISEDIERQHHKDMRDEVISLVVAGLFLIVMFIGIVQVVM